MRPKVAAIEPQLIVHQVGQLSRQDLDEVDHRLRNAMALITSALADVAQKIDFGKQPPAIVQSVAEKSVIAVVAFAAASDPSMELEKIRKLLQ
ncbi:MAG TPA: hypothetical protein P5121_07720 [Caldilineaceae bacterium]|nr:hypothetical protein [Caldilineaceae bacterium]